VAISPAGEVSEEAFAEAVDTLESNAAEHLPLAGKWASLAALPVKCTRNNCPARPDTVKALIKGAVKKRNSVVVIVAPKEHFLALAAAVVRSAPPLFSLKTPADTNEYELLVTCVEVSGGAAVGAISDDMCRSLTHAAEGIRLAQRLVDAPPNLMHTDAMVDECRALVARTGAAGSLSIKVIRGEELRDQGFGGLWNVGMAGPKPPALVVLSFDPTGAEPGAQTVCWVGKGIIYDTGGLSIKSKTGMPSMKRDMGGSAAVLGAFLAATHIGAKDKKLRAVICLAGRTRSLYAPTTSPPPPNPEPEPPDPNPQPPTTRSLRSIITPQAPTPRPVHTVMKFASTFRR
jgi:probable aminopeptidase NPEPL1